MLNNKKTGNEFRSSTKHVSKKHISSKNKNHMFLTDPELESSKNNNYLYMDTTAFYSGLEQNKSEQALKSSVNEPSNFDFHDVGNLSSKSATFVDVNENKVFDIFNPNIAIKYMNSALDNASISLGPDITANMMKSIINNDEIADMLKTAYGETTATDAIEKLNNYMNNYMNNKFASKHTDEQNNVMHDESDSNTEMSVNSYDKFINKMNSSEPNNLLDESDSNTEMSVNSYDRFVNEKYGSTKLKKSSEKNSLLSSNLKKSSEKNNSWSNSSKQFKVHCLPPVTGMKHPASETEYSSNDESDKSILPPTGTNSDFVVNKTTYSSGDESDGQPLMGVSKTEYSSDNESTETDDDSSDNESIKSDKIDGYNLPDEFKNVKFAKFNNHVQKNKKNTKFVYNHVDVETDFSNIISSKSLYQSLYTTIIPIEIPVKRKISINISDIVKKYSASSICDMFISFTKKIKINKISIYQLFPDSKKKIILEHIPGILLTILSELSDKFSDAISTKNKYMFPISFFKTLHTPLPIFRLGYLFIDIYIDESEDIKNLKCELLPTFYFYSKELEREYRKVLSFYMTKTGANYFTDTINEESFLDNEINILLKKFKGNITCLIIKLTPENKNAIISLTGKISCDEAVISVIDPDVNDITLSKFSKNNPKNLYIIDFSHSNNLFESVSSIYESYLVVSEKSLKISFMSSVVDNVGTGNVKIEIIGSTIHQITIEHDSFISFKNE